MKQQFIKVCMLSGLAMPLFSASLLAAGNPNPIVAQQQQVHDASGGAALRRPACQHEG